MNVTVTGFSFYGMKLYIVIIKNIYIEVRKFERQSKRKYKTQRNLSTEQLYLDIVQNLSYYSIPCQFVSSFYRHLL